MDEIQWEKYYDYTIINDYSWVVECVVFVVQFEEKNRPDNENHFYIIAANEVKFEEESNEIC